MLPSSKGEGSCLINSLSGFKSLREYYINLDNKQIVCYNKSYPRMAESADALDLKSSFGRSASSSLASGTNATQY